MWSVTDSDWCTFHRFIEQMVFFFFHFTRVEAYLKFDRNEIVATNFEEKKIIENKSSKRHLATSKKNSKQQNLFSLLQHVSKDSGVSRGKKKLPSGVRAIRWSWKVVTIFSEPILTRLYHAARHQLCCQAAG